VPVVYTKFPVWVFAVLQRQGFSRGKHELLSH
jgi:hypothetical protein